MTIPFPVRVALLVLICLVAIGAFLLNYTPFPQPPEYHNFADQRPMLGVPHMLNVASNLPFLLVGLWGRYFMASLRSHRPDTFLQSVERGPYWVFFIGLALTGIGSAYYHADPTNSRLTWDRMPLTIAFMGLFTAVLAERLCWKLAPWLLGPLVVLGIASVLYWHYTEEQGAGDVRFYFVVQFAPLLALPLLLLFFPPRYTGAADLIASLACYGVAKLLEILDRQVYAQAGLVSGHTLKHLVAGLGAYFILFMLQRRRAVLPATCCMDAGEAPEMVCTR
jgi:hypothetical protein